MAEKTDEKPYSEKPLDDYRNPDLPGESTAATQLDCAGMCAKQPPIIILNSAFETLTDIKYFQKILATWKVTRGKNKNSSITKGTLSRSIPLIYSGN